jgi:hypothetical protein
MQMESQLCCHHLISKLSGQQLVIPKHNEVRHYRALRALDVQTAAGLGRPCWRR